MRYLFLFAVLIMSVPSPAQTFFGGGTYRRSGGNENIHWTLADWMSQKHQFRLMDQWLALHRQRDFVELNIEGGRTNYDLTVGGSVTKHTIDRYSASLYLSIFGIEGGYEKSDEKTKATWGQFNVRVFGQSSQATHLVLSYGARKWEDEVNQLKVTNQYGAAKLQLYIVNFLGIDGVYRKSFKARDNQNNEHEGERVEYGAFLEHRFIRLYGRAFKDTTYVTTAGVTTHQTRDGVDAGIKVFF